MRRHYVGVIVGAPRRLQHGCREHLFGTWKTDVSFRPKVSRRSVSRVRRPTRPASVACSSVARETGRPHRSEVNTIQALMDIALPELEGLGDRRTQVRRPWTVMTDSPASPDPVCSTDPLRSPSPCLNLDALSSDDAEESVGLSDISVTLICGSDGGHTSVNSDQVLSDEDLPAAAGSGDRRQVIRIRDVSPDVQIVDISQVGRDWDSRRTVWGAEHPKDCVDKRMQRSVCIQASATEVRAKDDTLGLAATGPFPVVRTVDIPEVRWVETISLSSPPRSGQVSPDSPRTIAFEDTLDSSVPLSPNRVQTGRSQEVPAEGSLFKVSPVSTGFLKHLSGATVQQPKAGLLLPLALDSFCDPVLGDPVDFAQCEMIPGRIPL